MYAGILECGFCPEKWGEKPLSSVRFRQWSSQNPGVGHGFLPRAANGCDKPQRIEPDMAHRYYTDEGLQKIEEGYANLSQRCMAIQERCMEYKFFNERAKEFALHGFARRLNTLARCIQNVFDVIPPELEGVPTADEVKDAAIQVQAFVINVFGALDNLAWMWVLETDLKKPNGEEIPPEWIGLRPPNTLVRRSFSHDLQAYLDNMAEWFEYQEGYRHALAHQIPLYIPPYAVDPKHESQFDKLEEEITRAVFRSDFDGADALRLQRDSLKFFRPFIVHSWGRARPMPFHVQMIADFKTIEAISLKVLGELPPPKP